MSLRATKSEKIVLGRKVLANSKGKACNPCKYGELYTIGPKIQSYNNVPNLVDFIFDFARI